MVLPAEKIYQVAQIRHIEQEAIRQGATEEALMAHAGKAAFAYLRDCWPQVRAIAVVCGSGNNGGDGYVLAQLAHARQFDVVVYHLGVIEDLPPAALAAARSCQHAGVECLPFTGTLESDVDVIVDAVLGIGIRGAVRDMARDAIRAMNQVVVPVLAIDTPSGLNVDQGIVCGEAVRAAATITFIGVKPGLVTGDSVAYVGQLKCADLNLSRIIRTVPISGCTTDWSAIRTILRPRARDAHKGHFGHVLVIGGDAGMPGAVRMAAEAAGRVGAGLVTVVTRSEHVAGVVAARPELMCYGVMNAEQLIPLFAGKSVIVIGPGLGTNIWGQQLLDAVLTSDLPLVVDASALNLLAQRNLQRSNWVLTPHPGEAASLLHNTVQDVQHNRYAAARAIQQRYHGMVVLKGAGTVIQGDSHPVICTAGNPGMASGGMGDVLSGVVAGLIAQGLSLAQAAEVGVAVHAQAGDLAAQTGERGLLALDLVNHLRLAVNPTL